MAAYTLYHGTDQKSFDQFDYNRIGDFAHAYGYGFYFTPELQIAESYGKHILEADVWINNPVKEKGGLSNIAGFRKWAEYRIDHGDDIFGELGMAGRYYSEEEYWEQFYSDFLVYMVDDMEGIHDMYKLCTFEGGVKQLLTEAQRFLGYDGVIATDDVYNQGNAPVYVAWFNNQIKNKTWIK